jgi:curli biogenesis system outer membrane secretion channel CsgG
MSRLVAVCLAAFVFFPCAVSAQSPPSIAVLNFSTQGLTSNQWGNFEPGVALSDLLTDQLVNGGKFNVLDRKAIDSTLSEHQLSASGEVDPATAIRAGNLVGARYLVSGNILQLDATGQSGGSASQFIPGILGAAAGNVSRTRVTLKVAVRVVDAKTGQIVRSFTDEQTQTSTNWGTAGFAGETAGSYSNGSFVNSTMGHLVNDEAAKIAASIDPTKFAAVATVPSIKGHVAAIDGANIIISVGSTQGVLTGMYFDVVKTTTVIDPDSHKPLSVNETIGKIQVDSVSPNAAVAHVVSGRAPVRVTVQSEQP